jgi:hypothetical protein
MATKTLFCASCGKDHPHEIEVDRNHEILCRCECGCFVKFPTPESPAQLQQWFDDHKAHNAPLTARRDEERRLRKTSEDALAALLGE